jgi:hypothetical protein
MRKQNINQKQTNKQSVKVNIKINNVSRRRRQRALKEKYQKLQSLNQQRERLTINNVVSVPEYNKVNELNNKIMELERNIASRALAVEAPKTISEVLREAYSPLERYPVEKAPEPISEEILSESSRRLRELQSKNRFSSLADEEEEETAGGPVAEARIFSENTKKKIEKEPKKFTQSIYKELLNNNLIPNNKQYKQIKSQERKRLLKDYKDRFI